MLNPVSPKQWGFEAAAHLLNRAAFGGTPAEIESLARLSPSDAVDRILAPAVPQGDDPLPPPVWARPDPDRPRKLKEFREATPEAARRPRDDDNALIEGHGRLTRCGGCRLCSE